MISPIDFIVPADAQKSNYLYADMQLPPIHDSLATVVLKNGYVIDAGWYPPSDPAGHFVVRVLQGRFDELHSVELSSVEEVVQALESFAELYDRVCVPASNSSVVSARAQA